MRIGASAAALVRGREGERVEVRLMSGVPASGFRCRAGDARCMRAQQTALALVIGKAFADLEQ
jgi:hypothetical protein